MNLATSFQHEIKKISTKLHLVASWLFFVIMKLIPLVKITIKLKYSLMVILPYMTFLFLEILKLLDLIGETIKTRFKVHMIIYDV